MVAHPNLDELRFQEDQILRKHLDLLRLPLDIFILRNGRISF